MASTTAAGIPHQISPFPEWKQKDLKPKKGLQTVEAAPSGGANTSCSIVTSKSCPSRGTDLPPGVIARFPCKARNMPYSHREGAAYIDVPEDARHGTLLACSHPSCSGNGTRRRFSYCEVCKIPVSKRNFLNRHAHGLIEKPTIQLIKAETKAFRQRQRMEVPIINRCSKRQRTTAKSCQDPFTAAMTLGTRVLEDISEKTPLYCRATKDSEQLKPNEVVWLKLLHSRPSDGEDSASMQAWIDHVKTVGKALSKKGTNDVCEVQEAPSTSPTLAETKAAAEPTASRSPSQPSSSEPSLVEQQYFIGQKFFMPMENPPRITPDSSCGEPTDDSLNNSNSFTMLDQLDFSDIFEGL